MKSSDNITGNSNNGNTQEQEQENPRTPEQNQDPQEQIWDGTESELIADDELEEFDEQYTTTGILLEYQLKVSEVLECLKEFSSKKVGTKKTVVQTILLILLTLFTLISYLIYQNATNLIISIICIAMIPFIWYVPKLVLKSHAKNISQHEKLYVEIYPDNIVVGKNNYESQILLDGNSKFKEFENIFVIFPPNNDMLLIPIRAIEPEFVADVHAMLLAGTIPFDNED